MIVTQPKGKTSPHVVQFDDRGTAKRWFHKLPVALQHSGRRVMNAGQEFYANGTPFIASPVQILLFSKHGIRWNMARCELVQQKVFSSDVRDGRLSARKTQTGKAERMKSHVLNLEVDEQDRSFYTYCSVGRVLRYIVVALAGYEPPRARSSTPHSKPDLTK